MYTLIRTLFNYLCELPVRQDSAGIVFVFKNNFTDLIIQLIQFEVVFYKY